jgi:3',5'-cyclic AMP phosphodiesterase CpdA
MWRFVHLTDPHLASVRDGEWNNRFLCTMMPEVMACVKGDLDALAPDFLLVTGDICSHQTREAMLEARDTMESLEVPYYPMGGNHDFVLLHSRDWFLEAFSHRLPGTETFYSFSHQNLHFVVLDPWWKWRDGSLNQVSESSVAAELDMTLKDARWAIPPAQAEWLLEDLKAHASMPTIIAVHEPFVPTPKRMRRLEYKDSGAVDNGDLLLRLVGRYPQVKAIFSGHMHMNYIERVGDITQVVTSALPEYPTEFRVVDVHEDRLELRTHVLSDPSFAARSLIPGKDWTQGAPQDRSHTIPLQ